MYIIQLVRAVKKDALLSVKIVKSSFDLMSCIFCERNRVLATNSYHRNPIS